MHDTLRTSALLALTLPGIVCQAQAPASLPDGDHDEDTYQGEAPERYARVRTLEGDVRIRKGDVEDDLSRGTPIGEGDVLESRGRGVVQLVDGTRIAFAGATRFTVAALFKDAKGERQVLLRLDYGRLRVSLGGESDARFRIDTPSGQVTCMDKGTFTVEMERDRTLRLKVFNGRVTVRNERDEVRVGTGERLTVYGSQDRLDRVRDFNTYEEDEFDRWSERSTVVRRGRSWDRVPAELRNYSDELDEHGEWVHSDDYGWVWKPASQDEDWRPYYRGRWAAYPGGMTWVSDEPWGYVTYHHGRWAWGAGLGWYWIPGVYYSPAWVAWRWNGGYCGWAPLNYYNAPCDWGWGAWHGYGAWNIVSINHITVFNVGRHCYRDRGVISAFHPTGQSSWAGGRGTNPGWTRVPLMARPAELRSATDFQRVFQRDVTRTRLAAYDQQARQSTGRGVLRRELSPANPEGRTGEGATGRTPGAGAQVGRVPFEDRGRSQGSERGAGWLRTGQRPLDPPADRPREGTTPREVRAIDRPRDGASPRETSPRDLTPRDTSPRDPSPREVRPIDRPRELREERPSDRRFDRPVDPPRDRDGGRERADRPRETPREERPRETPRESRPRETREERPAPRQESRPAPPTPRQESRPAPPRSEGRGGRTR